MGKANKKHLVSLIGIFITDQTECPIESFSAFADASLTTAWSETTKIELKLPNEINGVYLSINKATPFRSNMYIFSQSTGYNLNV